MKIVIIAPYTSDSANSKPTINLANQLANQHDVLLILGNDPKWKTEFNDAIDSKIKIILYERKSFWNPTNIISVLNIIKCINNFNPDVVQYRTEDIFLCSFMWLLKRYPVVVTFDDPVPKTGQGSLYDRVIALWQLLFADSFIVYGLKLKTLLSQRFNLKEEKIHVVSVGHDFYSDKKVYDKCSGKTNKKKQVLFFGRVLPYKGLEYFIKAEPKVSSELKDVTFVIAGHCPNWPKYEQLMLNPENFQLELVWVTEERRYELFSTVNVVVVPYIDGAATSIIPCANFFGKPTVATDVGIFSEQVIDGVTGIIVPPKDVDGIAKAIISALTNPQLCDRERIIELTKDTVTWRKGAADTIKAYESTIRWRKKESATYIAETP